MSESRMEPMRNKLLSDVAAQAANIIKEHGIEADVAEQAGIAIADHLAEHWGGQLINFPKDYLFKLAERDLRIYNEFAGHNHGALASSTG